MTDQEANRLRAAYRAAAVALEEMRAALVAAGLLASDDRATESPAERKRRLAAERTRRWRDARRVTVTQETPPTGSTSGVTVTQESVTERHRAVDPAADFDPFEELLGPDPSRSSVTNSVTERHTGASVTSVTGSVTERHAVPPPASRARTYFLSEVFSPPCSFRETSGLSQTTTPPLGTEGATDPHAESEGVAPEVASGHDRSTAGGRERPALRAGATIDPSPVSVDLPAADRASEGAGGDPALALLPGVPEEPAGVTAVWSAYLAAIAPHRARLTSTRRQLIERRLRDYPVDDLVRSVTGYGRSAFHRGENDRGQRYQTLELWLRDAAHIEAGWTYLEAPAGRPAKKGAPRLDGIEAEWQEYERRMVAKSTNRAAIADRSSA